jgi:hypothetical protein
MSRRFIPPPAAAFGQGVEAEQAQGLVRARDEAYAEGHAAGLAAGLETGRQEGMAAVREECAAALEEARAEATRRTTETDLAAALERMGAARAADLTALEDGLRQTLSATLRSLFPVLMTHAAGMELQRLIADTLTERAPETLLLRAHPDALAHLTALPGWDELALRLTPRADDQLAAGAIEIAWTGGGLAYDPQALLERVSAAIDPGRAGRDAPKDSKESDA